MAGLVVSRDYGGRFLAAVIFRALDIQSVSSSFFFFCGPSAAIRGLESWAWED